MKKSTAGQQDYLAEYDVEIVRALSFCGLDVTFDTTEKKWTVKDPGIDMDNGRGVVAKNPERHIRFKEEDARKIADNYLNLPPQERKGIITAVGIFKLFSDYVTEHYKDTP